MMYPPEADSRPPEVVSPFTLGVSLLVHIVFFTILASIALFKFQPKETVIPIDLTVIVNENLDGVDNEPPPLDNPEPDPPKPEPKPEPKVEEPPKIEPKQEAVEYVKEKPKPEVKKPDPPKEEKKPEVKKPDPPKEEKKPEKPKESPEDRLKRMRESAKEVKIKVKNAPTGNGRTAKQTMSQAEIQKLLNAGYKPGTANQLAESDLQLGVSLIQMALNDRWNAMSPKVGADGTVYLSVKFAMSGRMVDVRLAKSCGDPISDRAALEVARAVGIVSGLSKEFIDRFSRESLTIRYKVQGR